MSEQSTIITFDTEEQKQVISKEVPIFALVPETSPILKQVMPEFDFQNPIMNPIELSSSLIETCKKYNGYGLSANQVGVETRVFVMGVGKEYIACFNPTIIAASTEDVHMAEGCLSFPMLALMITRPSGVVVDYQDYKGEHHQANFVGMSARCFLHELDHLNGIVYTSKCKPMALQQGLKKRGKINHLINKAKKTVGKL